MSFNLNQRVNIVLAETSPLGGGKHRGVIENIEKDMFDGTTLYLVKTKGGAIVPVREGAISPYKTKKK